MIKIRALILLPMLCWQSADADTPCGPDYPTDLPCISGGTHQRTVSLIAETKSMVITYPMSKEALADALKHAIDDSDWDVQHWRSEHEPDGERIRGSITKDDRSVGISVYNLKGVTVLQVTLVC